MTPVSHGKPCAGNPHARFDEGAPASEKPRRNALLHTTITDREIIVCGFRALVDLFGDVNAERFITLTIREPQDYTKWRENMYKNESLHSLAERSRAAEERFRKSMDIEPRVMS